jgi:hypothetical protein
LFVPSNIQLALTALATCEANTLQAKENAPASPGPKADITRCRVIQQETVHLLIRALESDGYDIKSSAEQAATQARQDEIQRTREMAARMRSGMAPQSVNRPLGPSPATDDQSLR